MNFRIGLCLVVAAALATCLVEAGVRDLRNKYRNLAGGSSAAAAASASSAGVSSSVSGSSPTGGYHYQGHHQPAPQFVPHSGHHQPHYYNQEPAVQHYPRQPVYRAPPQQHQVPRQPAAYYNDDGGLMDESVPQFAYSHPPPPPPPASVYGQHQHQRQHQHQNQHVHHQHQPHQAQYQYAPRHQPRHHRRRYPEPQENLVGAHQRAPVYQTAGVDGSSASAAAVAGGSAAAASATTSGAGAAMNSATDHFYAPDKNHHTVDQEELHQQYYEPETVNHFEAQSGTFSNGNGGGGNFEQGSYARDTESLEKHEDGREDGDHYYNAHAYGKSGDVNNYMAYNNKDEDLIHTPNLFRKKKSKTNFVSNFNKQHRETGSGVVAHDKHSAMYNKDTKKLKENVDQRYTKAADGLVQTKNFNSHADIDDEDELAMDSRGLGNFVGVDGVAHGARRHTAVPAKSAAVSAAAAAAGAGASAASAATHAGR